MGLYQRVCGRCGYSSGYEDQMYYNGKCPICDSYSYNSVVIQETAREKECRKRAEIKSGKSQLVIFAIIGLLFIIVFPGAMLLMLFHQMVDIKSEFLNWILCMAFTIAFYIFVKRDILRFFYIDILITSIITIISWCIKDFQPWTFVAGVLTGDENIILIILDLAIALYLCFFFLPKKLPEKYNYAVKLGTWLNK